MAGTDRGGRGRSPIRRLTKRSSRRRLFDDGEDDTKKEDYEAVLAEAREAKRARKEERKRSLAAEKLRQKERDERKARRCQVVEDEIRLFGKLITRATKSTKMRKRERRAYNRSVRKATAKHRRKQKVPDLELSVDRIRHEIQRAGMLLRNLEDGLREKDLERQLRQFLGSADAANPRKFKDIREEALHLSVAPMDDDSTPNPLRLWCEYPPCHQNPPLLLSAPRGQTFPKR
ncbi:Hypp5384 [Branchiostoma lanceolatum]|uniref:Hypp5384 protein n=1 Tax=Branchiostoma lanceolatum TaxID=7740 RepID=A0A8K0AG45_BRALA|nr:Hypp5384 [Branchiostoma lanceolatum]